MGAKVIINVLNYNYHYFHKETFRKIKRKYPKELVVILILPDILYLFKYHISYD